MWIRLPLLVVLGIAAFASPVAKQIFALSATPEHWVLLSVAAIGILLLVRSVRKFQWRFEQRPLTLYSCLSLLTCLVIGSAATWWSHDSLAVIVGITYFGSLLACGFSKAEWMVVRPYGYLVLLVALPISAASSTLANAYKQLTLKGASALLDAFQVRNVVDGDRIDGLTSSLQWADVSATFWSSSALFSVVALAVVWFQLRLIHGILILPIAVVVGMLMIAGRCGFIVGMNAAEQLTWVNLISFAIASYLAWVGVWLIRFAFDPIRGKYKSGLVPWWNRRTVAGLASIRLRNEFTALAATNTDPFQLPTIEPIGHEEKKRTPKRRSWIRRLARAFKGAFVPSFIFINDWCRSRRYRRLLPLVPLVFIGIASWMSPSLRPQFGWSENDLAERYAADVNAALAMDDRSSLEFLTRRLNQFSSVSDPSNFSLAKALFAIDKASDADAVLAELTDDPVNPYAPAQLWQAKRLLSAPAQPSALDQRRIKKYLRESLSDMSLTPEANWLLGQIYLQAEDDESALIHFRSIPKPLPETSLLLALIYKRRGDNTAYLRCLRNAEFRCKERLLTLDDSSQQMRLLLARALQLQERFSDAMKVLESSPDFAADPIVRQAAIVVDIAWFESLPPDQSLERQERIQHAIKLDATNPMLQKTLVAIAVGEANEGNQQLRLSATAEIIDAKKAGTLSGTSLTILGTKAAEMGKYEAAERQFRQAIAAGNESPLVLNNLAWVLAQKSDPIATQEAFILINRALNMSPKLAEFWKTRAEIWQQKGQDVEAIADLENAIRFGDQAPEVRLKLAELYDLQGDPETAQKYRNQVLKQSSQ